MKHKRLLFLLVLLLTATTGAWAGTQATGYFESCTAYHGSIRVKGWAYDPDQTATSIQVHAYIWYGSSVGTSNDQRMPAVGINTDVYREDVNNSKGTTGNHGFDRYITVPAGTYTVQIYAIDKTGDGNPKIPGPNGNPETYTIEVTADPYNITYDANGGSGAPAAQQKGEYVKINLSAAEPTRAGYVFKEWNTKQDGSGISYAPGAAYTADGDATLYAKWEAIPYTVSLNDGTDNPTTWTGKVGEATTFRALPLEGVAEGQTVTLQYSGDRRVKSVTATSDAGPGPLAVPLTIEAITPGIISVSSPKEGMQFSLDGGATKNAVTTGQIVLAAGDKVQFYGNGTSITSYNGTIITGSGNGFTCKVYGNIMSLVDETGFATAKTLSTNSTFNRLFYENTTLTDASGLLLPATELVSYCYSQMFRDCTSLTVAPELPATKLASNCYRSMFMGCTALTTAPVLLATTLVESCYYQIFTNCSKLATVTCLAESGINTSFSTANWLNGAGTQAQGTKTVYTVSTANWPSGSNSGIPTGWARMNIDN